MVQGQMTSYHKTILTGFIGGKIDLRYTPEAKAVAQFSVAVNDGWGDNKKTIWYRVTAWEKTAENCNQYLGKGSRVLVEGRL
jgi:single-strand DNA-binding protein